MSNKNNRAWEKLFDKYNILHHVDNDGQYIISADQIKEFREPRLMAKFDHTINLPKLFTDHGLAILPISRGNYVIGRFNAYHKFEATGNNICSVSLPSYIQSLNNNDVPSESIALNCAVVSGIISDFLQDDCIVATVSGRMGSGNFDYAIENTDRSIQCISVENSQIEIDAAYEGIDSLSIFEAKRDLSEDFIIRQLYYPFRVWQSRITKRVRPIFLVYSNGIYRLYEYEFSNICYYNSLQLIKQKNYSVEDTVITVDDIQELLARTHIEAEPQIPFPQADKFERVINLCELISEQEMSRTEVTKNYDFDVRQTNYYTDAARYLGLISKKGDGSSVSYSITEKGQNILNLPYKARQLAYCRCILSHKVFNVLLRQYFQSGEIPSRCDIVQLMTQCELYKVKSDSTFGRRAFTIKSWLNWIVSLIND